MTLEEFIAFLQAQIASGKFTGKEIVVRASCNHRHGGYMTIDSFRKSKVFACDEHAIKIPQVWGYTEWFDTVQSERHHDEIDAIVMA